MSDATLGSLGIFYEGELYMWAFVDGRRMKGGRAYNQQGALKAMVRWRDNFTCQLCGGFGWDVDHIIPWQESHDSSLGNLRVLCHRCLKLSVVFIQG